MSIVGQLISMRATRAPIYMKSNIIFQAVTKMALGFQKRNTMPSIKIPTILIALPEIPKICRNIINNVHVMFLSISILCN